MSRAWKSTVAVIASTVSMGCGLASAADLAVAPYTKAPAYNPPLFGWSGGYGGIEAGYGWGHSGQTDSGVPVTTTTTTTTTVTPPPPPPPPPPPSFDGNYATTGGLIGGTLGYDWQTGRWVYGAEGDLSWSDIKGRSTVCGPATPTPHPCGTSLDALGTVRGRVGYALGATGNWLLYGTGGLAVGEVRGWDSFTPASGSAWRAGWTGGAGVEVGFATNWTAKLEYLYVDLGKAQLFSVVAGVPETVSFHTNIVRAGVAYHFGGPITAKY